MNTQKNIWLILCVAYSLNLFSQKHLEFKGIEINGPKNEFVNKLIQKGFHVYEPSIPNNLKIENTIELLGTFLDMDCSIVVYYTKNTNIVYKIFVSTSKGHLFSLNEHMTVWEEQRYFGEINKLLKNKYGEFKIINTKEIPNEGMDYIMRFEYPAKFCVIDDGSLLEFKSNSSGEIYAFRWFTELKLIFKDAINTKLNYSEKSNRALNDM